MTGIRCVVAVAVGVGQLFAAVFPGASRSGTTILLALLLGLSRPAAIEFSFLVGIPTMLAASGLKIFKAFSAVVPWVVAMTTSLMPLSSAVLLAILSTSSVVIPSVMIMPDRMQTGSLTYRW